MWPDHTISTVFYDVTCHPLNKWKAKKESCEGWLFRGAVIALPPLRRPRAVICRRIEMRLAGRATSRAWFTHTVKSHRQPAAASVRRPASDTHIYLLPPKSEPYGFCHTGSRPQTAGWKCWMHREGGEGGGGSVNNFQSGISPEDTAGRKKARRGGWETVTKGGWILWRTRRRGGHCWRWDK